MNELLSISFVWTHTELHCDKDLVTNQGERESVTKIYIITITFFIGKTNII